MRPILDEAFPGLRHSAALLGYGSEVLGLDDARSTDHNWGPRVRLFLGDADAAAHAEAIGRVLAERLPFRFRGYPTGAVVPPGGDARLLTPVERRPIPHLVEVFALGGFLRGHLGFDPREGITARDWLTVPSQRLCELCAGAVYHDGLGELEPLRAALAWYPDDVWRHLLACAWRRIGHEEAFVGRTGEAGDDLGSRIVAARLARDVARLAFLVERRHAPYAKWLGSAFARLSCAAALAPALEEALRADRWQEREAALARAYAELGARTNALRLAPAVDPSPRPFHGRPFTVVGGERFAAALAGATGDPALRALPPVGSVDQISDDSDLLTSPPLLRRLGRLYGEERAAGRQPRDFPPGAETVM